MPLRPSISFLAGLLAILVAMPALADTVYPPGLRFGLEPAADLRPSARYPGFEDTGRNVSVTAVELPAAAYQPLTQAVAREPGVERARREDFTFAGGKGVLVSGAVTDNGVAVRRWLLVVEPRGNSPSDTTTLIRVEVPEAARDAYSDAAVRRMLASLRFREVPVDELLGLLPFTMGDLAGFRVAKVVPGSAVVTDGPSDDIMTQPYAIVSVGRDTPRDEERGRIARNLLAGAPVSGLRVTSADAMRITGAPGYEVRATAENRQGKPVALVQWVRFGGNGFLAVLGVAPEDKWDATFNRFRALRDGVDAK